MWMQMFVCKKNSLDFFVERKMTTPVVCTNEAVLCSSSKVLNSFSVRATSSDRMAEEHSGGDSVLGDV